MGAPWEQFDVEQPVQSFEPDYYEDMFYGYGDEDDEGDFDYSMYQDGIQADDIEDNRYARGHRHRRRHRR